MYGQLANIPMFWKVSLFWAYTKKEEKNIISIKGI